MNKRIIQWRIPRTGGTSVERGLDDLGVTHARMPGHRLKTPELTLANADYLICGHTTPTEVVQRGWLTEADIHGAINLLCVRNVFDRLVSLFALLRTTGYLHPGWEHWRGGDDFGSYIEWATLPTREVNYHERNYQCQPVSDWLSIEGRRVPFHVLGRFEELGAYWQAVCGVFGVTGLLPHVNLRPHEPYREYYTPELRDQVAKFYAAELEEFGYEF